MAHHKTDKPPRLTLSAPEAFGCPHWGLPVCSRCHRPQDETVFAYTEQMWREEFGYSLLGQGRRLCRRCFAAECAELYGFDERTAA